MTFTKANFGLERHKRVEVYLNPRLLCRILRYWIAMLCLLRCLIIIEVYLHLFL